MQDLRGALVAVTGGCGFIGSHLIRRLRHSGARVLCIDSLQYGCVQNLDLPDPGLRMETLQLERGATKALKEMFVGVDYVCHLAALKHNQSSSDPESLLDANVSGTYAVLEAAAASGVKKVLFASSVYAYGRMAGSPLCEDELPIPRTLYGISKLTGELICRYYSEQRGLAAMCLRLFFVYGPRQYPGLGYKSVILTTFERLLAGEQPVVNGDGCQQFDYIYVDDVITSMFLALSASERYGVFNVGNGVAVSIKELVTVMSEIAGVDIASLPGPADCTSGSSRVASTRKFTTRFGKQFRTPLSEGLRGTFDWVKSFQR